jgi:hypothetical protein
MIVRRPILLLTIVAALLVPPAATLAAQPPAELSADLAGRPIELVSVGRYYCHDFDYPRIHCFRTPADLSAAMEPLAGLLAATSTNYVLIFDFPAYAGSYMYVSQDYAILAFIGWNDRIGSFKAQNHESGLFYTDWLYGGSTYSFCCNQNVASLGSFDNTFSSVRRT